MLTLAPQAISVRARKKLAKPSYKRRKMLSKGSSGNLIAGSKPLQPA
ncbi:MAG: hypothetical protein RXR21_02325 [Nitrososphaeria archaeon]